MKSDTKNKVLTIAQTGMLTAIGIVFMLLIRFSILPGAKFLEYDMGDIPAALTALLFGPVHGLFSLCVIALVQALTVSAASSWQGFIMHFFATGVYIIILYFFRKTKRKSSFIWGLAAATAAMTAIMIPLNLIFTPMYLHTTAKAVAELILPAILPFNLIKGCINSLIIFLIFKPLTIVLAKSHLLPTNIKI